MFQCVMKHLPPRGKSGVTIVVIVWAQMMIVYTDGEDAMRKVSDSYTGWNVFIYSVFVRDLTTYSTASLLVEALTVAMKCNVVSWDMNLYKPYSRSL